MTISKLKLFGGYFDSPAKFRFFKHHKQVASVIYGKNGSGKSSLSRAFQEAFYSENENTIENEFSSIEFYKLRPHPKQGYHSLETSEITVPCYVHNDKFTEKTVSFNDDGLETIVMFGEQIDIKEDLEKLESQLETSKKNLDKTIDSLGVYSDSLNTESYLHFEKKIKDKLREKWAARHQKINNLKTLGRVDDKLFETVLLKMKAELPSYKDLEEDFSSELIKYNKIRSISSIEEIQSYSLPQKINKLLNLLSKKLQHPILSLKEQKILDIYSSLESNRALETQNFLKGTDETCPTCFQDVNQQYKADVLETIRKILNTEEANNLLNDISQISLEEYIIDFSRFDSVVDDDVITDFKVYIEEYNKTISLLISEQKNKINNPYNPITIEISFTEVILNLNKVIDKINLQIKTFNKDISQSKEIATKLKEINQKLAILECNDLINVYRDKLTLYKKTQLENKGFTTEVNELNNNIAVKKASLANVEIASDLINDYLQYIFYDQNRLYLTSSNDTYKVMSRGLPVKPSSLSVGEKNIISLCYFFSTLFQNQNIKDLFKAESLLVLDDPISSFDFENKVGVYSFLRYILNELHKGNAKSKSIIFTHDLDVLYNMAKLYSDIKIPPRNNKLGLYYLEQKSLQSVEQENYDEYSLLLQNIFDFTVGSSHTQLNVGNDLRRILEAFATFNYKCGIEDLTVNPEILEKLSSKKHEEYFKNSMYRLVLNTESHLKERSKLLLSRSFKEHFSIDEKKRTAKDMLMLIYLLNDVHLKFHLKKDKQDDVSSKLEHIETWIEEVFNRDTVTQ